jgi:hypothetical protein
MNLLTVSQFNSCSVGNILPNNHVPVRLNSSRVKLQYVKASSLMGDSQHYLLKKDRGLSNMQTTNIKQNPYSRQLIKLTNLKGISLSIGYNSEVNIAVMHSCQKKSLSIPIRR